MRAVSGMAGFVCTRPAIRPDGRTESDAARTAPGLYPAWPVSIHWPIIRALLRSPRRVSVIDDRRSYRAIDLLVGALHVAAAVKARCDRPTVGVMLPTGGAFPITALAGWMLGKTIVPLNYLLKPEELQYVVDNCETDTLVTVGPMLEHLGHTPRVKHVVTLDTLDFRGVPDPLRPVLAGDDDLAVLLYTSGTSGKPKGVMLTHGNLGANVDQVLRWIELTPRDSLLGVLPQFHSFGLTVLTLMPLAAGLRVVYPMRFIPQKIVRLIKEHRPTVLIAIPSMYNALLSTKDAVPEDFSSLRLIVSGGEPLPDAVAARFYERFNIRINEGYGLTETSPATNWCRPFEYRPHSVGKALPDIVQRIVDPQTGLVVPPGHDGEVQMTGPNVMRGYFKLPNETAAAFTPDGFFRTGDIGRLDDDGHLYITGRLKEMLIIGGENVFPREIEEALNRHPAVADSGVIGIEDPMRGELPLAFVELREGAAAEPMELLGWCRRHLAGYKVPGEVRMIAALPRNATGKIVRRDLRKLI
jgi:long-chain acyl-CoA synthetase